MTSDSMYPYYFVEVENELETFELSYKKNKIIEIKYATEVLENFFHQEQQVKIFPQFDKKKHEIWINSTNTPVRRLSLTDKSCLADEPIKDLEGLFRMFSYNYGPVRIQRIHFDTDAYIPMNVDTDILEEDIHTFLKSEDKYKELDMKYRRGALIYGPPGNGKTFSIMRLITELAKKNKIVTLMVSSTLELEDIWKIRDSFGELPIILVFEEVTEYMDNLGTFLNFLDGEYSWNNCYTIATTNYPEKLPASIVSRPGRFDTIIGVKHPDSTAREAYFSSRLTSELVTKELLKETADCSIAYLREIVIRSQLFERSPTNVAKELKEHRELAKNRFAKDDRGSNYL